MKHLATLLTLILVSISTTAYAQEKTDAEWEKAYQKLLKNPAAKQKIEATGATKEQVIDWMKKQENRKANPALSAFRQKLKGLVESGKLTKEEAAELYETMAGRDSNEKGEGKKADGDNKPVDLKKLANRLGAAVKAGKMTAEEAKAAYQKAALAQQGGKAGANRKGAGKGKPGSTNFYAIVIGRLKSKDIELGEFTLDVDYVTSIGGNRWVKDQIVGKTVKVNGVSGEFRDKLLQIKRGETLKVRTGSYVADSNTLGFGYKFHVLERTQPFKPEDFGVPPQDFRGFRGILQGKIVEVGGYEVLMTVDEVAKVADGSKAANADSIKGKLVRVNGFFNQHRDAFEDLHEGDTIRVSVIHANPTYDELGVTDLLEKVGQD